jgi:hypothetical protein
MGGTRGDINAPATRVGEEFRGPGAALALQTLSLTSKNGAYALCVFLGSPANKDTDSHDKN